MALSAEGKTTGPADSLKISKDISLDEVVVTATKVAKGTPVAYSELTKDELNRRNDGQGIPFLILQSPSVIMTSDAGTGIGYSGFRIRGTDANRINITVNGVPVNDSESHTVFWVNMPDFASSVDNIQIQRGAGTSTNGAAAFGATVAMQTQKSELKPYAEYSVSAGSFGTVKNTVKLGTGLLQDHFVFDARYSNIQSDGYIDRAKANMHSYFASAAYYGDNTLIRFQTFGSIEKTYQAWTGVPSYLLDSDRTYNPCGEYKEDGVTKYYKNQTDNYRQQNYHLTASQRLSDLWNMNLTLHYTHGAGYYEDYKGGAKVKDYKLPPYIDKPGRHHRQDGPRPPQVAGKTTSTERSTAPTIGESVCNSQPEPPSTVTTATTSGVSCGRNNRTTFPNRTTNITVTRVTSWITICTPKPITSSIPT